MSATKQEKQKKKEKKKNVDRNRAGVVEDSKRGKVRGK